MARPIWKGQVSFGLVTVPVTLFSAEQKSDLHFQLIDSRNSARVRYRRVNEQTGKEVPWDQIVKGYEYADDNYVLLSDEELESAAVKMTRTVEIEEFVDVEQISPLFFDRPYFLVPEKAGEKGYVILREAMKKTGKVGIAKVVIHTRQYLAAMLPAGEAIALILLRFDQELRSAEDFDIPEGDPKEYQVKPKELDLAQQLIEGMSGEWEPAKFHDEYRDALMKMIEKKIDAGDLQPVADVEEAEKPTSGKEVINLMDALKASIEHSKGARRGSRKKNPTSRRSRRTSKRAS